MSPLRHFTITTILIAILYPFYGSLAILAYLTGFLVDIDHLWEYFKHNSFTISFSTYKDISKWYKSTDFDNILQIFHTVEFLALLIILSFYYTAFQILTISYIIHWSMDFYHQITKNFMHHRNFSIVYWLYQKLNK